MISAGCDVGSLTAKGLLLNESGILASEVIPVSGRPPRAALEVMNLVLKSAGLSMKDVTHLVGTGYGRKRIDFAHSIESEITCHGMGAWWGDHSIRTIIDIGGQDAKAIRVNHEGEVTRYVYNDKCASGTGRFLEIMAEALEVPLDGMASEEEKSTRDVHISSQCVIFAESEVISLVNEGVPVPDIIKGLHGAMAARAAALARSIGIEERITFSGGVARNGGVLRGLEESLGTSLVRTGSDPQLNGALGGALIGARKCGVHVKPPGIMEEEHGTVQAGH